MAMTAEELAKYFHPRPGADFSKDWKLALADAAKAIELLDPPVRDTDHDLLHRCINFVHNVNKSAGLGQMQPVDELVKFVKTEIARASATTE